jgi:hypothetical protein
MCLVEFEFKVSLIDKKGNLLVPIPHDQIVHWYQNQLADVAAIYDVRIIEVSYVRDDVFKVGYIISQESDEDVKVINHLLADPDDDGNYPIKIGRKKYLVVGEIV